MADCQSDYFFPILGENYTSSGMIVGIGASTGGTEAVLEVLRMLPEDSPGIVIVQHMPPDGGFTDKYAQRLDRLCRMKVREAKHGDEIRRGHAFVAPADYHTRIVKNGGRYILSCTKEDRFNGHRPSVDMLFYSMAENVECDMVGVILTGMGDDGAKGLLAMHRRGAYTIGQDKGSSVIYGMPREAYRIGALDIQAPCGHIAGLLYHHFKKSK